MKWNNINILHSSGNNKQENTDQRKSEVMILNQHVVHIMQFCKLNSYGKKQLFMFITNIALKIS